MSIDKVKNYFKKYVMDRYVQEFSVSSKTVELAALALNTEPSRIAKSITFEVNDNVVMIVTSGDTKIDNAKFKQYFGVKAKMLPFDKVEIMVGHAVGGVCPFAVNENVQIYLDNSLKRFETVFPACGSSNSAIELTISELEQFSNSIAWVDVCKMTEN